jgi:hypothetical protein
MMRSASTNTHCSRGGDEAKIALRKMFAESGVYTVYRYYTKFEWTDEEKEMLCTVIDTLMKIDESLSAD